MARKTTQGTQGGSAKKKPAPKKSPSSRPLRPAILITGAGSGIGLAFTEDCLAPDNHRVWGDHQVVVMVARNPQKLKEAASRLRKQLGKSPEILTLAVDLSLPGSTKTVMGFVSRNHLRLIGLINNAGVGHFGEFASMPPEKVREIIHLNISSLTELTHAVLAHMRNTDTPSHPPFILNVASVVGLLPFPLTAVYAASKAYVVSFSEALRMECEEEIRRRGYGVEIYTLCPGSTRTDFFERAGKPIFSENRSRGLSSLNSFMDPVQVVEETRKAISEKKPFIIPGTTNRFIPLLARLLPRKGAMQIAHRFMKDRLKKQP